MFEYIEDEDLVSVFELANILSRRFELPHSETIKLGRYLVEPLDVEFIDFDENTENTLASITQRLLNLLGDYELITSGNEVAIQNELKEALEPSMQKLSLRLNKIDSIESFENLLKTSGITLSSRLEAYCIYLMYKNTKDINKLEYAKLLQNKELKLNPQKAIKRRDKVN